MPDFTVFIYFNVQIDRAVLRILKLQYDVGGVLQVAAGVWCDKSKISWKMGSGPESALV